MRKVLLVLAVLVAFGSASVSCKLI